MILLLTSLLRGGVLPVLLAVPGGPGPNSRVSSEAEDASPTQSILCKGHPPDLSAYASPCIGITPARRLTETVDLIELNHFYDDLGRHSYDQVIFYEWSPDYARFHVIAWSLIEKDKSRIPRRDSHRKDYFVRWHDRDSDLYREVRSKVYRETWSQVDPERENKKLMQEKHRIALLQVDKRR